MAAADDLVLVPLPDRGRVIVRDRRVRLGDVTRRGRLRLDAVARYLQDVADDDVLDAEDGHGEVASGWVVRRTVVEVARFPGYQEPLVLRTWCSGTGRAWAERRTRIEGAAGSLVESATLWVHLDPRSMRPSPLSPEFLAVYGPATGDRRVRARLHHEPPPPAGSAADVPWALRVTDLDVLGHVNNAVTWEVVEEQLAHHPDLRAPLRAEVEHHLPVEPGDSVGVRTARQGDGLRIWLVDGAGAVKCSAVVRRLGG
jgi:acyl-ACP thioesterase